jgi:CHRD domain
VVIAVNDKGGLMRRTYIAALAGVAALALGATALIGTAGGEQGRAAATTDVGLVATLTGTAEPGGGDRDGRGAAYVLVTSTKICYGLVVNSVAKPTAAHIHRGRTGVNGPIVLPLRTPTAGNHGQSGGCVSGTSTLRSQLKSTPTQFYVNVHNTAFPNGAIRGQLRK